MSFSRSWRFDREETMRHCLLSLALLMLGLPAHAQQPEADDALSSYLRRSYAAVSRDVAAAVAMMPEEHLGFRPVNVVEKVRTFGEIAAHLLTVNYWICAVSDGKPERSSPFGASIATDKARLVAAIEETDQRCTAYLASLTDKSLVDVITTGPAENRLQTVRGNSLVFAIAHANEHYGNLVTYLRAKGLVPPATPSQASFLSPVRQR
jgi:uncharacterized damage-inducible protein DinB